MPTNKPMDCLTALLTLLDQVDYTRGNCSITDMVGAVLPKEVIMLAREAARHEMGMSQSAIDNVRLFSGE